jgi:hypothetical protein
MLIEDPVEAPLPPMMISVRKALLVDHAAVIRAVTIISPMLELHLDNPPALSTAQPSCGYQGEFSEILQHQQGDYQQMDRQIKVMQHSLPGSDQRLILATMKIFAVYAFEINKKSTDDGLLLVLDCLLRPP